MRTVRNLAVVNTDEEANASFVDILPAHSLPLKKACEFQKQTNFNHHFLPWSAVFVQL